MLNLNLTVISEITATCELNNNFNLILNALINSIHTYQGTYLIESIIDVPETVLKLFQIKNSYGVFWRFCMTSVQKKKPNN